MTTGREIQDAKPQYHTFSRSESGWWRDHYNDSDGRLCHTDFAIGPRDYSRSVILAHSDPDCDYDRKCPACWLHHAHTLAFHHAKLS